MANKFYCLVENCVRQSEPGPKKRFQYEIEENCLYVKTNECTYKRREKIERKPDEVRKEQLSDSSRIKA